MFNKPLLAVLLWLICFPFEKVSSQCCSTGSPAGASVYVGVLSKNSLRAISFYRHQFSDTYYKGREQSIGNNALKSANFNFVGLSFAYGISKKLTLETDLGYFVNKSQTFAAINYTETGFGLSNGGLTIKYGALVRPIQNFELTLGAGFRYPFSTKPLMVDNVQLTRDVQPSTNAMAISGMIFISKGFPDVKMRLFSINRFDHNFQDKLAYAFGDVLSNSVFVSRNITKNLMGLLQIRNEYRWKDKDQKVIRQNSGNHLVLLSPQLNYRFASEWNVSMMIDLPVYKHYSGKQLTPSYSFAVGISRDVDLNKFQKSKKKTFNPSVNHEKLLRLLDCFVVNFRPCRMQKRGYPNPSSGLYFAFY